MGNVNSLKLANIDNCVWKAHPFTLQAPYVEYLLVEKKKKIKWPVFTKPLGIDKDPCLMPYELI